MRRLWLKAFTVIIWVLCASCGASEPLDDTSEQAAPSREPLSTTSATLQSSTSAPTPVSTTTSTTPLPNKTIATKPPGLGASFAPSPEPSSLTVARLFETSPRNLSSLSQFMAWTADGESFIGRVGGALGTVNIETGETLLIGDVPTPYDALVTGDWLWYSAPGELTAIHTDGYTHRFEANDRFQIFGTDGEGGVAIAKEAASDGPGIFVFDARQRSSFVIPTAAGAESSFQAVLSPDGRVLINAEREWGEDIARIFSTRINSIEATFEPWTTVFEDRWMTIQPPVIWLAPDLMRVNAGRGIDDVRLLPE